MTQEQHEQYVILAKARNRVQETLDKVKNTTPKDAINVDHALSTYFNLTGATKKMLIAELENEISILNYKIERL